MLLPISVLTHWHLLTHMNTFNAMNTSKRAWFHFVLLWGFFYLEVAIRESRGHSKGGEILY